MSEGATKMSKVVLITGTSTGIGLSSAVLLAKRGCTVVATMRDLDKARALRERAEREGVTLDVRRLDVSDDASVASCTRGVLETYGRVDVLVNNAGAGCVATLEQLSLSDLARTMEVNFYGVVRVTQSLLPRMREARSGRIVTVSSVGGIVGQPFNDAYCAAKFAVEGLMECFAPVAAKLGVDVVLVEPGPVATEFVASVRASLRPHVLAEDSPYAPLLKAYMTAVTNRFAASQTADEVAEVVAEAALAERPQLRYPTSPQARDFVSVKSSDPTGREVLARMSAWL